MMSVPAEKSAFDHAMEWCSKRFAEIAQGLPVCVHPDGPLFVFHAVALNAIVKGEALTQSVLAEGLDVLRAVNQADTSPVPAAV